MLYKKNISYCKEILNEKLYLTNTSSLIHSFYVQIFILEYIQIILLNPAYYLTYEKHWLNIFRRKNRHSPNVILSRQDSPLSKGYTVHELMSDDVRQEHHRPRGGAVGGQAGEEQVPYYSHIKAL